MFHQEGNVFYACGTPIVIAENAQGETHAYGEADGVQLSVSDLKGGIVYGGGRNVPCASTSVTMRSGLLYQLYGGGVGGEITGSIRMQLEGGVVSDTMSGGGIDDTVQDIEITATGGVVKWNFFAGGNARSCRNITVNLAHFVCYDVFTGSVNPNGVQTGNSVFTMRDGVILNLHCGGPAPVTGFVDVTVTGGYIEKQILPHPVAQGIRLHLHEGIRQEGGLGVVYPKIPEDLAVEWLPARHKNGPEFRPYRAGEDRFFDRSGEAGKLVFRFFELRNPEIPKNTARFPNFIGDCILTQFPNGEHMLIDTGLPYAEEEVVHGLAQLGIEKLEYLQLTHYHADHLGNAGALLRRFRVGTVILPKMHGIMTDPGDMRPYIDLLEEAERQQIPILRVVKGDCLTIGSGETEALVEFLNPAVAWVESADLNRESIVTRITFRGSVAMLGGDITNPTEEALALEYGEALACDLLKLSHHGIIRQSHYRYLDACSPTVAVVHNLREDGVFMTATRYQLNHIHHIPDDRIFVTGLHGRIKAVLTGEKGRVTVTTQYT